MATGVIDGMNAKLSEFYTELVTEHYDFILNYIKLRLPDKGRARDVTQDTFLAAWRSIAKLHEHPNIRGWLVNAAKYKILHANEDDAKIGIPCPEATIRKQHHAAREQDMDELFVGLSTQESTVLLLYYQEEMSIAEAAAALKISADAVKMCLSRARRKAEKAAEAKNLLKKIFMLCYVLLFF